jgi:hypothetical protein
MRRFATHLAVIFGLVAAPLVCTAAHDPLDSRVTMEYRNAAAADVLGALARGAGFAVEIAQGDLRPVTITVTNVRLGTALNAVCENASCRWSLQFSSQTPVPLHGVLKVTPLPNDRGSALPPRVSFDLRDTPASDVFRALAAAINVPVTVDPDLPAETVNLTFKNAATADVLELLCEMEKCEWSFDPAYGLRVTKRR